MVDGGSRAVIFSCRAGDAAVVIPLWTRKPWPLEERQMIPGNGMSGMNHCGDNVAVFGLSGDVAEEGARSKKFEPT